MADAAGGRGRRGARPSARRVGAERREAEETEAEGHEGGVIGAVSLAVRRLTEGLAPATRFNSGCGSAVASGGWSDGIGRHHPLGSLVGPDTASPRGARATAGDGPRTRP